MQLTVHTLLQHLPPFRNERIMIKKNQRVNDIIKQMLIAHKKYAHYYDELAKYFDNKNIDVICNNLYQFLKDNIEYREESEDEQTTALPGAILTLQRGDCKHYSSFTAGILDALKRRGADINWCYRFCSYDVLKKVPHHVFVVVKKSDGEEIWIDAVPGANELTPVWQLDKKINSFNMPLYDVVGNTVNGSDNVIGYTIGEQIQHAAARVLPTLIAGRGAFLQMVKWNVRAWAKNMDYLIQTQGKPFTDRLGKKWYLMGGRWDNLYNAIQEGKSKKMIGGTGAIGLTGAEIIALVTAAAPIIIAITSVIKDATGNQSWQEGQLVPGLNTSPLPGTGSGTTEILKNPVVLAAGAAGLYLLYTSNKKKSVNGTSDNLLLLGLIGGGLYLLHKMKTGNSEQAPEPIPEPPAQIEYPIELYPYQDESNQPGLTLDVERDSNINTDFINVDTTAPIEAMM